MQKKRIKMKFFLKSPFQFKSVLLSLKVILSNHFELLFFEEHSL
jgi:hypothetical protein